MATNRVCKICGKKYHFCPTCGLDIYKPSWFAVWCSEDCKKMSDILSAHTVGVLTTEQAKEELVKNRIENIVLINPVSQAHLDTIINNKSEYNKDLPEIIKEIEANNVDENITEGTPEVVEKIDEIIEEQSAEEQPILPIVVETENKELFTPKKRVQKKYK